MPFNTENRNLKKEVGKRKIYLLSDLVSSLQAKPPTKTIPKVETQADLKTMSEKPAVPFPAQSNNNNNNREVAAEKEAEEESSQQSSKPKNAEPTSAKPKQHQVTDIQQKAVPKKNAGKSQKQTKTIQQIEGQGSIASYFNTKKRKRDGEEAEAKEAAPDDDAGTENRPNKKSKKK